MSLSSPRSHGLEDMRLRHKAFDYFLRANPFGNLDNAMSAHTAKAGTKFLSTSPFLQWLQIPGYGLYLCEIPRTGISLFQSLLLVTTPCRNNGSTGVAFYACDARQDAGSFLHSSSMQLARQSDLAYQHLEPSYNTLNRAQSSPTPPDIEDIEGAYMPVESNKSLL
jgi:hypothetical protein